MKKVSFVLLGLGIVLIILALVFPKNAESEKEWKTVYNDQIMNNNYDIYDIDGYYDVSFRDVNDMIVTFLVPNEAKIGKIVGNDVQYSEKTFFVKYMTSIMANMTEEINIIHEDYANRKMNVNIKRRNIDSTGDVIIYTQASDTDRYIEELNIYAKISDNIYSKITYSILNKRFSDDFLSKVIAGLKRECVKEETSLCVNHDNKYNCDFSIDAKIVNTIVDASKYKMITPYIKGSYKAIYKDLSEKTRIDVYIVYDNVSDIKNVVQEEFQAFPFPWETGENLLKYNASDYNHQVDVLLVNERLALVIDITSDNKIDDNLVNDFLNIKVS